jgi:hypothetical protein
MGAPGASIGNRRRKIPDGLITYHQAGGMWCSRANQAFGVTGQGTPLASRADPDRDDRDHHEREHHQHHR